MDEVRLGATPLCVTRFGIGLAALGRPGYITLGHGADLNHDYQVSTMEARTHQVLDRAYDLGVRYFDAARSYGRAEAFLASWLATRRLTPEALVVGSKWGYTYTAGWQVTADQHEVKEHTLPVLRRQWAESRSLLGPHLKLYQIHSATLDSGVLGNRSVLDELARLKQAGMADRAVTIAVDGVRLFDAVQATWNLLEPSAGPALERAHQAGLGVIVKEALANGRLSAAHQAPESVEARGILQRETLRLETALDALALAAALAQPWADVVLSGAATVAQLESNLGALGVRWDAQAVEVLGSLAESPQDYWAARSRLHWN
jgi:aryl-alcohol dehydrogenase-like predicted oxidoreductase